jgi:hypothetical protein
MLSNASAEPRTSVSFSVRIVNLPRKPRFLMEKPIGARQAEQAHDAPIARRVVRVLTRPGLHAFEAAYDPLSRLPEHGHAAPFFTYVLRGSYIEHAGYSARQCGRGAVIFHDRESHRNEVGSAGTVSFNVELDPELWRELTEDFSIVRAIAGRVLQGDTEWPALRLAGVPAS